MLAKYDEFIPGNNTGVFGSKFHDFVTVEIFNGIFLFEIS